MINMAKKKIILTNMKTNIKQLEEKDSAIPVNLEMSHDERSVSLQRHFCYLAEGLLLDFSV